MNYWTFSEYKQNRIDAAKSICRFYFTKAPRETMLISDSLDFSDM